jgi:hypothetical protein
MSESYALSHTESKVLSDFSVFCVLFCVQMYGFFYIKILKVKIERKFNCSSSHRRFSILPWYVSYICDVPPELMYCCSATYLWKDGIFTSMWGRLGGLPNRWSGTWFSHLWLVNFYLLTIWLAADTQMRRIFFNLWGTLLRSISSQFLLLLKSLKIRSVYLLTFIQDVGVQTWHIFVVKLRSLLGQANSANDFGVFILWAQWCAQLLVM